MRSKLIFWILCLPALAMASDLERTLPEHHRQSSLIADIRIRETLDFCGEPVPLEIGEVRERLERELLLTLNNGPQIILWMKRAARYLPYIEAQLAQRGLPGDLKFVP
ncbi:MAG TPA: lytic transglycosylase, partial [Desulfobacterales bacterium]